MAGGVLVEEWTCPACGSTVGRRNPAWKGVWFTAVDTEVVALCARQHHRHDRRGRPVRTSDAPGALTWQELAMAAPGECRLPVVAVDPALDAYVTPGLGFRRTADGRGYDVVVLDEIEPSSLIGSLAPLLAKGGVVGTVPARAFTAALTAEGDVIDAACLRRLVR